MFVYYYCFSVQTSPCDLLVRVLVSERSVLSLVTFILSELLIVLFGLKKASRTAYNVVSEGVLLPLPPHVRKFVDGVGFLKIVSQCSFDA